MSDKNIVQIVVCQTFSTSIYTAQRLLLHWKSMDDKVQAVSEFLLTCQCNRYYKMHLEATMSNSCSSDWWNVNRKNILITSRLILCASVTPASVREQVMLIDDIGRTTVWLNSQFWLVHYLCKAAQFGYNNKIIKTIT